MTFPASSSGGEFLLDVEKARVAVRALEVVHRELAQVREQAFDVARQPRTATDSISSEAFDLLAQKAAGGPGSFVEAVNGALAHVESLIAEMEKDIEEHVDLDVRAAAGLHGS